MMRHPAKFSDAILKAALPYLANITNVFDPFCGVGGIAGIRRFGWKGGLYGTEIEPEWAQQAFAAGVLCDPKGKDLFMLDRIEFDAIFTSPCYGNRMADHHEAKDASRRHTYRHCLRRPLSSGSSAGLQWGRDYQKFHELAWRHCIGLLAPKGTFILNISDHIRRGQVIPVAAWHRDTLTALLGLVLIASHEIPTRRNRHGANGDLRVPCEMLYVFRKP